uniref:Uncharacterized protein n=1 Tax=Cacopsylla melanoneura TaxID=428564 RepID=A0A8D9AJE6_9HEMI
MVPWFDCLPESCSLSHFTLLLFRVICFQFQLYLVFLFKTFFRLCFSTYSLNPTCISFLPPSFSYFSPTFSFCVRFSLFFLSVILSLPLSPSLPSSLTHTYNTRSLSLSLSLSFTTY